jgi:predicted metalloendopeptidase
MREPAAAAARVLAFETRLAEIQWERERLRDPEATYNRMTLGALAALSPSFDWGAYLRAAGVGAPAEVVVGQPDYVQGLERVLATTPIETLREHLTSRLLDAYAAYLPQAFVDAQFEFRGRVLAGAQAQQPRWRRAIAEVGTSMGEALGQLYVARHYPPDAGARMDALVQNLLAAFRTGIDRLEWMSPVTRQAAQAKLARFTVKIGHPEKWEDYSTLAIRSDDLVGNVMRARTFRYEDNVRRLGGPVDRTEWLMTPQTVNAYYDPTNNEIAFPAAILQPPLFDATADDAANYGAIGAIIGHEISHGFDDQGRKYDGSGNLTDWWTAEDASAFVARADRLVAQFGSYSALPDLPINGRLTLGENIGDLSGLAVAYAAYRASLRGREAPVIAGFTGDQRFFMGWAQGWRERSRDEAIRRQVLTDPHSPAAQRAFVALTNLDAFHEAFDTRPGDAMYRPPEERVKLW